VTWECCFFFGGSENGDQPLRQGKNQQQT